MLVALKLEPSVLLSDTTYSDLSSTSLTLSSQASIDAHQNPLTDEALDAAKNAHAILLGAIGGPKYGTGAVRPEQGTSRPL